MDLDFLALLLNSLVTYSGAAYIFFLIYKKKVEKHPFYYTWAFGFLLYATQLFLREFFPDLKMLTFVLTAAFFIFLSFGLWSISRSKKFLLAFFASTLSLFLIVIFYLLSLISSAVATGLFSLFLFIPLTIGVIYNRITFGRILDKFIFGWILLLLVNSILYNTGWVIDVFATFAKVVIFLGVKDHDFAIISQKIKKETAILLPSSGYLAEGSLRLVVPRSSSVNTKKVDWVSERIRENAKNQIASYVFAFQDTMPHKQLQSLKWMHPELVHVFLFSSSAQKGKDGIIILKMGIAQVGAALSELIKEHLNSQKCCMVFFMDLSLLIHMFGVLPCYNMLLSKMGSLREAGVNLFAFFHPETHSDKSVFSLFKNIADDVIDL